MLESLAAWVLNTYIGEYLENLNTEQLSIGLLQGHIQLDNVPLKKTALRKFDLPLGVKSGVLGKLTLSIPLTRLRSEPWVVVISDLQVVLEPVPFRVDVEFDEQYLQTHKISQLDALEIFHRRQLSQVVDESSQSSWLAYGASLVSSIVDNIQLVVNNVHVRYEDSSTIPGGDFAAGIKIDRIAVQSTDNLWNPGYVLRNIAENMFKMLELVGFSVYWTPESAKRQSKEIIEEEDFVLSPINASVKLERNCSKFPLKQLPPCPRFKCDIVLERLQVKCSRNQIIAQHSLAQEWSRYDRARQYRKWRPRNAVTTHAKLWWMFAINCHMELIRTRDEGRSWKHALHRARNCTAYVNAYIRRLMKNGYTKADIGLMKQIENEYSYEVLHVLRDLALRKILRDGLWSSTKATAITSSQPTSPVVETPTAPPPGFLSSWLTSWYYGSSSTSAPTVANESPRLNSNTDHSVRSVSSNPQGAIEDLPVIINKEDVKEMEVLEHGILDVIHDAVDDSTLLRRDVLFAKLTLRVQEVAAKLIQEPHVTSNSKEGSGSLTTVLSLAVMDGLAQLELSPRHHSTKADFSVGSLHIQSDLLRSSAFDHMLWVEKVTALDSSHTSGPFLHCIYERHAPKLTASHKIFLELAPVQLLYYKSAYDNLYERCRDCFFSVGSTDSVGLTQRQSTDDDRALRERVTSLFGRQDELKESLSQFDVRLNIAAPKVHVPDNLTTPRLKVVFDFGQLQFRTADHAGFRKHCDSPSWGEKTKDSFSEEDLFVTPPSTPPWESSTANSSKDQLTQSNFENCLYHKYYLDLKDLQVLLFDATSSTSQSKVTGDPIVQKFSISCLCLVQKLAVTNTDFPNIKATGRVPELRFQLNQRKLEAFSKCLEIVSSSEDVVVPVDDLKVRHGDTSSLKRSGTLKRERRISALAVKANRPSVNKDQSQSVFQFTVDQLCVEMQGNDVAIGELQLGRVTAEHCENKHHATSTFCLQSLLLVDAMQTYGPDYELVVASHRELGLDVASGTLKSGTTASSLVRNAKPLARLRIERVKLDGCNRALLQFSNLDITVNQRTIIVLHAFFRSLFPAADNSPPKQHLQVTSSSSLDTSRMDAAAGEFGQWEVEAWFGSLNMLLYRETSPTASREQITQKVATCSLHGSSLNAKFGDGVFALDGRLDGLHVRDLVHGTKVVDFGLESVDAAFISFPKAFAVTTHEGSDSAENDVAFNFGYHWRLNDGNDSSELKLTVASIFYTHSLRFLQHLGQCYDKLADAFGDNAEAVRQSAVGIASELIESQKSGVGGQKLRLNVVLKSPVVTFLLDLDDASQQTEFLTLHLGTLRISSDASATLNTVPEGVVDQETYRCSLHNAKAYSVQLAETLSSPRYLGLGGPEQPRQFVLSDTSFECVISKCLMPVLKRASGKVNETWLDYVLCFCAEVHDKNPLNLCLTRTQYAQILRLVELFGDDTHKSTVVQTQQQSYLSVAVFVEVEIPEFYLDLIGEPMDADSGANAVVGVELRLPKLRIRRDEPSLMKLELSMNTVHIVDHLEGKQSNLKHLLLCCRDESNAEFEEAYLSTSCPDVSVTTDDEFGLLSTSLPSALSPDVPMKMFAAQPKQTNHKTPKLSRKSSLLNSPAVFISLILVDAGHADFESLYQAIGCHVTIETGLLDFVFNQQTLVILLDFFNLEGGSSSCKKIALEAKQARVVLNKPKDGYQLAQIIVDDFRLVLLLLQEMMVFEGSTQSFQVLDKTPLFSQHYPEKLKILYDAARDTPALAFKCTKYRLVDLDLTRECDVVLDLRPAAHAIYLHSQRFIMELTAFFMHFFQLQDMLERLKLLIRGQEVNDRPPRGTRVKLRVELESPSMAFPVSAQQPAMVMLSTTRLAIDNAFLFHSQLSPMVRASEFSEHDCLLDVMHVQLWDAMFYKGIRGDKATVGAGAPLLSFDTYECCTVGQGFFVKPAYLDIVVQRNLDAAASHAVPDIAVAVNASAVQCNIDIDQYRTLRGVIEHNFGEDIPAFQVPPEFRADPSTLSVLSGRAFCGFRFALVMTDVVLYCSDTVQALARVQFKKAGFKFESFSDTTKELDLTCEDTLLYDIRFEDVAVNKRPSAYPLVLSHRPEHTPSPGHLLVEVHLFMAKDRQRLTCLLSNTRVVWVPEWFALAQAFLLSSPLPSTVTASTHASAMQQERPKMSYSNSLSVGHGILTKSLKPQASVSEESFELKLNLMCSEVVLVENLASLVSAALLVKSTCVIQCKLHPKCLPTLSCTVQSLAVDSCVMADVDHSRARLLEPLSVTLELQTKAHHASKDVTRAGFLELAREEFHHLEIALNDVFLSLSYHNCELLRSIFMEYVGFLWSEQHEDSVERLPLQQHSASEGTFSLQEVELRMESLTVCLFDDLNGRYCLPLVKCQLSGSEVTVKDLQNGLASCSLCMDYFNTRTSSWEPFLEPLKLGISWTYYARDNNVQVDLVASNTVDFTLTNSTLEQVRQFQNAWITRLYHPEAVDPYTARKDYIAYVLVNDTGDVLMFSTSRGDVGPKHSSRSGTHEWLQAQPGASVPFAFELSAAEMRSLVACAVQPHQIVIKLEGWCETHAVSVDSVGTFFRMVKMEQKPTSTLASMLQYARLVVDISLDDQSRKRVCVRSSLLVVNCLPDPLDLKLENTSTYLGDVATLQVPPHSVRAVPVRYVSSKIFARPSGGTWAGADYCRKHIAWQSVTERGHALSLLRDCVVADSNRTSRMYRFCVRILHEHYPDYELTQSLPGHSIAFVPPLTVQNLLPAELYFIARPSNCEARVESSESLALCEINLTETLELSFSTEYMRSSRSLVIPAASGIEQTGVLLMHDVAQRPFQLQYKVQPVKGGALKVILSAPFWIVNKSALALVVKQEGVRDEAAGQVGEHEAGRMLPPFMFSFADSDAPKQCQIRLGRKLHPTCSPKWCKRFVLEPGITFRQLLCSPMDNSPDLVYDIGVEVRKGQGLYQDSTVVILSPRYQLQNRSTVKLSVAQLCFIEHGQFDNRHDLLPQANLAWHWPRQDRDRLLCVRRDDVAPYWSQGFRIDRINAFHVNIRDRDGVPHFLGVEVVLHGALHYVTFSNADALPAPMRLENHTDVPVLYQQRGVEAAHLKAMLRPNCAADYCWDNYLADHLLQLTVFGNMTGVYDPTIVGDLEPLIYENYFCVALSSTFNALSRGMDAELVLEAMPKGKIVLAKKEPNKSCQLWRMKAEGLLENVGFSRAGESYVLDILSCGDPHTFEPLMLRKADPRRKLTQRWEFTRDERLRCQLKGLYVQVLDHQLKQGNVAVLGPVQPTTPEVGGVPIDQWVVRQKYRPGSGCLTVTVVNDGPTKVVRIIDRQSGRIPSATRLQSQNSLATQSSVTSPVTLTPEHVVAASAKKQLELLLTIDLKKGGLGLSLVSSQLEELLYARLSGAVIWYTHHRQHQTLSMHVMEIQMDNQLPYANRWQFVYVKPKHEQDMVTPALNLQAQWSQGQMFDTVDLKVELGKAVVEVDELFLWKLMEFVEQDWSVTHKTAPLSLNYELEPPPGADARRCYFGILWISCRKLHLSVITANVLPPELKLRRAAYNMRLVRFENASVQLVPFHSAQFFGTYTFLGEAVRTYFIEQLKGQALKILGSVDFLGNPLGLFNDVTGGLSELLTEGNISGLVAGIAHGFSNSTAKFTSSLASGVGKISMDESHQELRERFKGQSGGPLEHLLSGVTGLGIGILGGTTSIIQQSYDGATRHGFAGFMAGFGKGVVGTVTRPVQGVLDFTSGVATAAKAVVASAGPTKSRFPDARMRYPRLTVGLHGTLPPYSIDLAAAQKSLLAINANNPKEICLFVESVKTKCETEPVFALVTTECLYFLRQSENTEEHRVGLRAQYGQLVSCTVSAGLVRGSFATAENTVTIEVQYKMTSPSSPGRKAKVVCDSLENAERICNAVLIAKARYDDVKRCLAVPEDTATHI